MDGGWKENGLIVRGIDTRRDGVEESGGGENWQREGRTGIISNFIFHAHVINVSDEYNLYFSAHEDNIKPK